MQLMHICIMYDDKNYQNISQVHNNGDWVILDMYPERIPCTENLLFIILHARKQSNKADDQKD